jgi:excisionase family DNA binding protein
MKKGFTIKEIAEITGKSDTTIYRYLKKGKIPFFTVEKDGQTIYQVKKSDLESFLGHIVEDDEKTVTHNEETLFHNEKTVTHNEETLFHNEKTVTHNEKPFFQFNQENLQEAIFQAISQQQNQLMKPMEEQALYIAGKLSTENQFLKDRLETLRQENELLREQVKILPAPADLENKESAILKLQKEKEDLLSRAETIQKEKEEQIRKAEGLNQVLLDNANNIKELTKEKDNFQTVLKEHEATIREKERALKDLEDLHRQELEQALKQAEEEKKQIAEVWKKELEEAKRPWWKFW